MLSRKGRHRRPSRTGTAVAAAGTGLAATAIIASSATGASASTLPAPSAPAEHLPVRAVADMIRSVQPRTYTVKDGDTLSGIAGNLCGNPADWTGIWDANRKNIPDWNLIYKDQVFIVACKTAKIPQPVAVARAVTYAPRHAVTQQAAVQRPEGNVSTAGMGGFQSCVITRESGGNPQVWNYQGYPYWGLYQFGAATWAAHGGNPADWGHAGSAEQTRVFWNTVHADGTSDWSPSDGC